VAPTDSGARPSGPQAGSRARAMLTGTGGRGRRRPTRVEAARCGGHGEVRVAQERGTRPRWRRHVTVGGTTGRGGLGDGRAEAGCGG
jgi:hypothetical protein